MTEGKPRFGVNRSEHTRKRKDRDYSLRKNRKRRQLKKTRDEQMNKFNEKILETSVSSIHEIIDALRSDDIEDQRDGLRGIRRLVSIEGGGPYDDIIECGLVGTLLRLCQDEDSDIAHDALWCITNICSGTSEQCAAVVEQNGHKVLIEIVDDLSNPGRILHQAVWALTNIAGDCTRCRDLILHEDGVYPVVRLLQHTREMAVQSRTVEVCIWCLSNFARGKPAPYFEDISPCLSVIGEIIKTGAIGQRNFATWTLSYIADVDTVSYIITILEETDIIPTLVEHYQTNQYDNTAILRCIGNIASGHKDVLAQLIDEGVLELLKTIFDQPQSPDSIQALWVLSNLVAASHDQIQAVIDQGFIGRIVNFLLSENSAIRQEALWVCSNICTLGSDEQKDYMVEVDVFSGLIEGLRSSEATNTILAADALIALLKRGNTIGAEMGEDNPFLVLFEEYNGSQVADLVFQRSSSAAIIQRMTKLLGVIEQDAEGFEDGMIDTDEENDDFEYNSDSDGELDI
ncbi:hypothetical protein PCE1_000497 [Barthelona sp. PCE]